MTEAEWLACSDPQPMILFFRDRSTERKWRLFGAGCCRAIWGHLTDRRSRRAVEVAERFADGLATREEVQNVRELSVVHGGRGIEHAATLALTEKPYLAGVRITKRMADREGGQCHLLREVFGNPFRPVTFSPEWRTDTVVSLARQMYEARDFGAMPILADALQDAGCDNENVLSHCRGPCEHVRGCWVVDLVLGRE